MRHFILLITFIAISTYAYAQETKKILTPPTEKEMRELITEHINTLRATIQKAAKHSRGYSLERALDLFRDNDVVIEVSKLGVKEPIRSNPKQYFTALYNLIPTQYDSVKIKFRQLKMKIDPSVHDGVLYVWPELEQKFEGFKNGISLYADVTIKRIGVQFGQRDGAFYVKITSIEVESTEKLN